MSVTWIIEQNVFNEKNYDDMIECFVEHEIPHDVVRIIPFIHEVEGRQPNPETKHVVCYGSIGIQKLAARQGWNPGVWTNDNFNSEVYKDKLGSLFLNSDAVICKISEVKNYVDGIFFIKPNSDTKEFAGMLMEPDEFEAWYQKMLSIGYLETNDFDVAIAKPVEISKEYRCIVVGGKIVTGSLYKEFGIVRTKQGFLPEFQTIIDGIGWEPAPIYVVDFGLTIDGWKIIEYNTFNSAGFYDCSPEDAILAINQHLTGD